MAAQLMAMNGPGARGLLRWMALATSSLPVPLCPRMSTVAGLPATRPTIRNTSSMAGLAPMAVSSSPSSSPGVRGTTSSPAETSRSSPASSRASTGAATSPSTPSRDDSTMACMVGRDAASTSDPAGTPLSTTRATRAMSTAGRSSESSTASQVRPRISSSPSPSDAACRSSARPPVASRAAANVSGAGSTTSSDGWGTRAAGWERWIVCMST